VHVPEQVIEGRVLAAVARPIVVLEVPGHLFPGPRIIDTGIARERQAACVALDLAQFGPEFGLVQVFSCLRDVPGMGIEVVVLAT